MRYKTFKIIIKCHSLYIMFSGLLISIESLFFCLKRTKVYEKLISSMPHPNTRFLVLYFGKHKCLFL